MRVDHATRSAPLSTTSGNIRQAGTAAGAAIRSQRSTGWRSRRASPFSAAWVGILPLRRSWPLLSTVALGILVAVVLIATVPLYTALVTDVQLQRELTLAGPLARNVEVVATSRSLTDQVKTSAQ